MLKRTVAVITRKGEVVTRKENVPELKENEVLIKVMVSLISPGTEMNKPRDRRVKPDGQDEVFGYANAGEVMKVNGDARGLKPGMRVTAMGTSYAIHGNYAVVPINLVMPIPDSVSYEEAVFMHLGITAMLQQGVLIDNGEIGRMLGQYSILVKLFLPDAIVGLKGKDTYAATYAEALHVFAHGSHFMLAGRDFWDHYVRYLAKSYLTSGFTLYGVGAEEDHSYCEVAEMWAFYTQTALFKERYGNAIATNFGHDWWFHPQIFEILAEDGLSWQKIFQVLGSDVTDREILQKKLNSYYPEHKSTINKAFAMYN